MPYTSNNLRKGINMHKYLRIIIGLLGLSFVIVIHEFGHFIACKLFGIATPVFSIGFGPRLIGYKIGSTLFQIAAFPLGGYVAIATAQLDAQPYVVKAIILLAGIAINFLFAYLVFTFFRLRKINVREMMQQTAEHADKGVMGPIGIIALMSYSVSLSFNHFLLLLGGLSFSIGMFNLLPIPFLDGGQLALYTIEAITGPISDGAYNITMLIFFILFLLFIFFITIGDIRKLWR